MKTKLLITIKKNGYKITPQRKAVINSIAGSHSHFTPESIHKRVSDGCQGIGLATIYRTINILLNLRLVCELYTGGNCHSYVVRRPVKHHHHLVCSSCKKVVDFTDCDLKDIEIKLSKGTGFKVDRHLLEFIGTCPDCQKAMP